MDAMTRLGLNLQMEKTPTMKLRSLPQVTAGQILTWCRDDTFCLTVEEAQDLLGDRRTVDAHEVLTAPIPAKQRLYAILRPEFLHPMLLASLVCDIAGHAIDHEIAAGRLVDPRTLAGLEMGGRILGGGATPGQAEETFKAAEAASADAARFAVRPDGKGLRWDVLGRSCWGAAWSVVRASRVYGADRSSAAVEARAATWGAAVTVSGGASKSGEEALLTAWDLLLERAAQTLVRWRHDKPLLLPRGDP